MGLLNLVYMQFWIIHQFNLFGKHNIGFDAHTLCCPQTRTVVGKQCPQTRTSSFEDSGQRNHKKNLYHISCRLELKAYKLWAHLFLCLDEWERDGKVLPYPLHSPQGSGGPPTPSILLPRLRGSPHSQGSGGPNNPQWI